MKRDPTPSPALVDPLEGFPCHLGDVIIRAGGEEAWLAGAVVLSEEVTVAALFVAPDAGQDCAIFARPKPDLVLAWLRQVDPSGFLVAGEPPTSIEIGGARFERQRRLPLNAKRIGTGTPDVGEAVIVAEYTSAGPDRLVVITGGGSARAFRGVALEEGMYEVLPSGKGTLET